ncbi:MAG: hypothetical protein KAT05_08545 [Spirochaetes bacterium]|nr:hypothetical protein [Spirochaetota bacterium]
MSISVKLKTKDEETGAKVIDVKISSSQSFKSPTRSLTSTEHNYKVAVIDKIVSSAGLGQGPSTAFENEIFQVSKQFNLEQLHRYLKLNGTFNNAKKNIVALKNAYVNKFIIFYPQFTKKMLFDEKQHIGIENLKTLVDLQTIGCQLENITIPESNPNQNFNNFKKDLTFLSNRAETYGCKNLIPYLDMGMGGNDSELFANKYNYLIDSGYPIIGVAYRSINQHYPNFRYLQERADDVLIVGSDVGRYWQSNWTTAQLHIPNFFGIDVTSLGSKASPGIERKPIDEIKRFDKDSLGIIKLGEHESIFGEHLNCNCPVCTGKTLSEFKTQYSVDSNGGTDTSILDKFCKLHEVYSSTDEFNNERKFIEENDTRTYINNHEYLSAFFNKNKF